MFLVALPPPCIVLFLPDPPSQRSPPPSPDPSLLVSPLRHSEADFEILQFFQSLSNAELMGLVSLFYQLYDSGIQANCKNRGLVCTKERVARRGPNPPLT